MVGTVPPVAELVPHQADERPRTGGQWRDRVRISEDFDDMPPDLAEAFGMMAGRPA